jgi:hypothetical protein
LRTVLPVYSKVTKLSAYGYQISSAHMTPREDHMDIHSGAGCREGRPLARTWTLSCVCGESSREEVISAVSGGDGTIVEQMLAGSIWPRCVVCGLCEQTRLTSCERNVGRSRDSTAPPATCHLLVTPVVSSSGFGNVELRMMGGLSPVDDPPQTTRMAAVHARTN